MREINQAGLDLIRQSEGLALKAYRCPAGRWTIGYGHTATAQPGQTITPREANELLAADLLTFEQLVEKLVKGPLTDNQFAALVSFVFNIGGAAFSKSTLLKRLNAGQTAAAADQFLLWTKAAGKELPGLVKRRAAERDLFLRGD